MRLQFVSFGPKVVRDASVNDGETRRRSGQPRGDNGSVVVIVVGWNSSSSSSIARGCCCIHHGSGEIRGRCS
jgi:hypothetical protein